MRVLAVNAGSSTLKLTLLDDRDRVLGARELPMRSGELDRSEIDATISRELSGADAVGHRIVHGGERFTRAVVVDAEVEAALGELVDLAPLHQPKSLAALQTVAAALPELPTIACFDTAFHTTLPAQAHTYALPPTWRKRWPLRRFGFHGLSHSWVARRVPELLSRPSGRLRIVSCHLGAGASLCAIVDGRSLDTTMGFTPLEGLVMATRCGSVDPGLLLWLLERSGMSEREVARALEHESGMLGLSGSADMREVLARVDAGDEEAELALEVYIHRLRAGIAAMAASMDGLDVLVFTGGVGENAAQVRARTVAGLVFLGLAIDDSANAGADGDRDITAARGVPHIFVLRTREDLEIASQVRALLAGA